jgi:hypothetical protein
MSAATREAGAFKVIIFRGFLSIAADYELADRLSPVTMSHQLRAGRIGKMAEE